MAAFEGSLQLGRVIVDSGVDHGDVNRTGSIERRTFRDRPYVGGLDGLDAPRCRLLSRRDRVIHHDVTLDDRLDIFHLTRGEKPLHLLVGHLGVKAIDDVERARKHAHSRGGTEVFARQPFHSLIEWMGRDDDVMLRRSENNCGKGNEESDKRQPFH